MENSRRALVNASLFALVVRRTEVHLCTIVSSSSWTEEFFPFLCSALEEEEEVKEKSTGEIFLLTKQSSILVVPSAENSTCSSFGEIMGRKISLTSYESLMATCTLKSSSRSTK